jgi:Domain of unknown function DUF302
MSAFRAEAHTMTRVHLDTAMPFDAFVTALEEAAPAFDPLPVQRIVERGGTWDDVRAEVAKNAPNELMRYGKIDATPLLGVAGHDTRAIEYLIGNHVIAESMFRHDPRALLYAPLRMLVYSNADGHAVFTMDKPSDAFGSLGIPEVTAVGEGLDRKVANLLHVVGVDAGDAFA